MPPPLFRRIRIAPGLRLSLCHIVGLAAIASAAHAGDAPCGTRDFTVDGLTWDMEEAWPGYIVIRGRVINHCSAPSGVQITVTVNDADGKPLTGKTFWPNGTSDIAPGAPYWFLMPFSPPHGSIGSLDASVVGTERWSELLN